MAVIEKFLGRRVEIPEDRHYFPKQGLWAKPEKQEIVFGFTEPALVLSGGVNDLDWLVSEEEPVGQGDALLFVITGKILYLDAPAAGVVRFNHEARKNPATVARAPYGEGWLFRIAPEAEVGSVMKSSVDAAGYIESLKGSEGFKNPSGVKGGVSGICKAVYTGIKEQKISP